VVLLSAGLLATLAVTREAHRSLAAASRREFEFAGHEINLRIAERLQAHERILRSGVGLFAVSQSVHRIDWYTFVQTLQIDRQLPGIQGVGYTEVITPRDLASHEQRIRSEGFPQYRVWPPGDRDLYSAIIFLEPFIGRNLRAFGYDMLSEAKRHEAMMRACDENTAALTAKVTLVQETTNNVQAGTLMFHPVYAGGKPVTTAAERRASLQGWVYSPYRMTDLMEGILGGWASSFGMNIRLRVFDGEEIAAEALLYDSQPERPAVGGAPQDFTLQKPITCAGRRWTLLVTQPGLHGEFLRNGSVWRVAAVGTALSLLLAGLLHSLLNTRHSAQRMAQRLTADLQYASGRLALATEAGGVGIWDYEVKSETLIWDDQMIRLYGITRPQFSGKYEAWRMAVHPDDRQRAEAELQSALRGEREFDTEFRVVWPIGAIRHLQAQSRVHRDPEGRPLRVVGTNWDITSRKESEAALREREENFRAFFQSITDMIMVATREGRILFTNTAVGQTLGYGDEELAALTILELHPVDKRAEAVEIFGGMLRGERSSCPLPLERKDGSRVPVETRVWFGQWNGADCIFGISKNLSAEIEAQQRFERLFRSNPALLALSSLPGGRFFDVNASFLKALGYSQAEVIGRTATDLALFPDPDQRSAIEGFQRSRTRVADLEVQVRRQDGATLATLYSGEVITSQRQEFLLTVMIDITERKRVEEELLRTLARERELSALKSTFVSMVSHEFRTPLSAILSSAEMLEDFYDRLSEEKRQAYFQLIRREVQRLASMLQDVLLQGQLDAGRVQYSAKPVDVDALCREVVARVQATFPKHPPVQYEIRTPHARTLTDENLLERMLSNLLSNALKYSPNLTPVRFTVRFDRDTWLFEVRDQGLGIHSDDLPSLFSAFRRGGNVGTIKGSGVGLYIVKKCADLQGGRVELETRLGTGSTFTVHLPWQRADPS
jgi:PAS domain S-box-containing protein